MKSTTRKNLLALVIGVGFGFVLSRSGATDYNYIVDMFLFRNFQLYGVIGSAVVVGALGYLLLIKVVKKTPFGEKITPKWRTLHKGTVVGSLLFGIGWALSGACPGTIIAQLGEGKVYAVGTFVGALTGVWLVSLIKPRLRARGGWG